MQTFKLKTRIGGNMCSSIVLAMAALSGATFATAAHADEATAEAKGPTGDIVVTARRKSENLLKTPISITALTAEDIAAKGTTTIQDIAQSTPGLNVQSVATTGGRADRSFMSIQLRGFVPSSSAAQTSSIFIDGAPVSVATALQALTNPERVEIIKGPQSALFGRQTFAGAMNVVTKKPSDHLTASGSVSGGTHGTYDVQAEVSAPIIDDVLSFRASVRALGKKGSYYNTFIPNQSLGDQATKTGSLAIRFKPTSNFTVDLFGLATELKDGPAATGLISAVSTPAGQNLVVGQSNCTITSSAGAKNPFFCGVAPGLSALAPSANTASTAAIVSFLQRTTGRVLSPSQGVQGYGLVNHFRHLHGTMELALGDTGITLTSQTAWNKELKSELADLDNYYSVSVGPAASFPVEGFYNFPFMIEARSQDFSQELRASFENGGPLHASVGTSYLFQKNQSDSGSPYLNSLSWGGVAKSRTYGVFGSVGYDFSDAFTLNADARWQLDRVGAYAGQGGVNNATVKIAESALIVQNDYKNFMPRVIAQFNLTPRNMFYASWSKGINPGQFNTLFVTSPEPLVREQAAALGYKIAVDPEKVTNYEIGAKGRVANIRYELAAYLAYWTNQIQSQSTTIASDGRGPSAVGAPLQVAASVNTGRVRVTGLEANFSADLAPGLTADLAGAYVKTYILDAVNPTVAAFYNIPAGGFRGKENAFVSKWSANASLAYTKPLSDEVDGFGRVDFTYKKGGWADIANVVRAPDLTQVNVRIGAKNKTLSIEGYVTNLFNNRAYYSVGSSGVVINGVTTGAYGGLIAQLRDLRTWGMRASFNF
jgi:iron complex outermembrane receptor protein